MNPADLAFFRADSNYDSFGYLAIMAAAAIWLAWANRAGLAQLAAAAPNLARLIGWPWAIFAAVLALRLAGLATESLWYDESFTGVISRLPLPRMLTAAAGDVHPPAFYILEWVAVRLLGASDSTLRLLPALASSGAAAMVYVVGREHLSERVSLGAALAAGMLPGLAYYGTEARQYSILALLCLVALWADRRGRWLAYTPALALMLYTHNYGWLYWAGFLVAGLLRSDRRQTIATAAAAVFYLPWLPFMLAQVGQVADGFWLWPLRPGRALIEPFLTVIIGYRSPAGVTLAATGAALALSVAGFAEVLRSKSILRRAYRASWLILVLLPPLTAAAASILIRPLYLPRGFIPSAYILILIWATWLDRQSWRTQTAAAAVVLVLFGSVLWPAANTRSDIRGAIAQAGITAGDTVYHTAEQTAILFTWYLPDTTNILADYPAGLAHGLTEQTRAAVGITQGPPVGDFMVLATAAGQPPEQYTITQEIRPGPLLATLFDSTTQSGGIYEFSPD